MWLRNVFVFSSNYPKKGLDSLLCEKLIISCIFQHCVLFLLQHCDAIYGSIYPPPVDGSPYELNLL